MEKGDIARVTKNVVLATSFILLTSLAFSRDTRARMMNRANGRSEISGVGKQDGYRLHASHYNHDKTNPDYDNIDNGRILTIEEHYIDHVQHEGKNGLSPEANTWAINKLYHSMTEQERGRIQDMYFEP